MITAFLKEHVRLVGPLAQAAALTQWNAAVSGDPADYEAQRQAQLALETLYSDPEVFARGRALRAPAAAAPLRLRRQLDLVVLAHLEKQVAPALLARIIELQNEIDRRFSTFRGTAGERTLGENDLRQILRTSADSRELRQAWEAGKQVGAVVQPLLLEVVKLRNEQAQQLGYGDFFSLQMAVQEFDEAGLLQRFDVLDALTGDAFTTAKAGADARLAARYAIDPTALQPWHYHNPFFQECPEVFAADLAAIYAGVDVLDVARRYFASVGFDVSEILARSDLFERPGKNPHAFCTHIDRQGDVRVFANVRSDEYWMGTLLHELGHAVYDQGLPAELPYVLRMPAHTLTTEAVAMLFGRLSKSAPWMHEWAGLPAARVAGIEAECRQMLQFEQLVFSRWAQVMVRFERALYRDPDQDLDTLWWDLTERYQGLRRPEGRQAPDWAAKYHLAMVPVYYHNYALGEWMASQLHETIVRDVLHADDAEKITYSGSAAVGAYLRQRVFAPGAELEWDELVAFATGRPLGPEAFAAQFVTPPRDS